MLIPLFLILTVLLQSHASFQNAPFQNAQEIHLPLEVRNPSYGGYALAADPCPAAFGSCPEGKCCPLNTYCNIAGASAGYACCPDTNNCVPAVKAAPACADDSWVLWYGVNGYFCCQQGEIGILPSKGQARVGFCVRGDVPVSAQQSATLVAPAKASGSVSLPTGSGSASVMSAAPSSILGVTGTATVNVNASGSVSLPTGSSSVSVTSAAPSSILGVTGTATVNAKSTAVKSSSAAATGAGSAKVGEGIFLGVVGVVSLIFLAFFRDMLR